VQQACVTAGVVVDVKAGALKRCDHLFWLENRKLGRHSRRVLREADRNAFRGEGMNVARNMLAGFEGALQKAAYGVPRHVAGFLQGLAERADLRDGRHNHIETALG
jgi:hypothetical protein